MQTQRLRRQANGLIIGFGLQFVFGMVLNLFVELPSKHSGTSGAYMTKLWDSLIWTLTLGGGWTLFFHVVIALALLLGSLSLFVAALRARSKLWGWVSGFAALFTLTALLDGLDFASSGNDKMSLAMAFGWLLAVGLLVFGSVKTSKSSKVTLGSKQR